MSRLFYDKPFFRTVRWELKQQGFIACSPWTKNIVASYRLRGTVISILGGNEIHITKRGVTTKYETCSVIEALRIIDEAKAERS